MWTHIYGLDIETDTTPETPEELAAGYKPGNRGLDPRIGSVINIAIAHADGEEVFRGPESEMLSAAFRWLQQAPVGLISTWNGSPFDFPFLADRLRANGDARDWLRMSPNPDLKPKYEALPGHAGGYDVSVPTIAGVDHAHLDVAYALKAKAAELGVSWSLKPVMKALGVDMVEVDRERIHLLTPAEQDAYVASDARGAREAAIRLLTGTL